MTTKSISDIRALFSNKAIWQSWLDVEAALATVQAEIKMIPNDSAKEINQKANLIHIDVDLLSQDIQRTKAPVVSLTKFLSTACDDGHGKYVHWGATTQNIIQTGRILQVRKAYQSIKNQFGCVIEELTILAEKGSEMIMAGRTQRRQALPITFGFKVAGWIDEFLRHVDRFNELESRFFCLQFGGAIGAMQSFGEQGPELIRRLAKSLKLTPLAVHARSSNDYLVEYVTTMTLFATTCSKIAQELYTLMSDEIAEVAEGQDQEVVGSSTMPHKKNSKIACNIISVAARIKSQLGLAFDGMLPSHEGDLATNKMINEAIDTVSISAYELTTDMNNLIKNLELFPQNMLKNLSKTNGLIVAENVMMTLAPIIGRQKAHDLVHNATLKSIEKNQTLFDVLRLEEVIQKNISDDQLRSALDPANYIGHCKQITNQCVERARFVISQF